MILLKDAVKVKENLDKRMEILGQNFFLSKKYHLKNYSSLRKEIDKGKQLSYILNQIIKYNFNLFSGYLTETSDITRVVSGIEYSGTRTSTLVKRVQDKILYRICDSVDDGNINICEYLYRDAYLVKSYCCFGTCTDDFISSVINFSKNIE